MTILDNLSHVVGRQLTDAMVTTSGISTNYGSAINGVIDNTGATVVNITTPVSIPASLSLTSVAANGQGISYSQDNGQTFFFPTQTQTDTNIKYNIAYVLNFPVTQIVFIGDAGDTWYIV